MAKRNRFVLALIAVVVLAFGLGCLNYTKHETIDHHASWAAEHGAPAPGPGLFKGGVLAVAAGAGLLGFALGRR